MAMRGSRLLSIFLVVFVDLLGFGLILPLLPFYAQEYGASETVVGLLVASYALAQFFGAPMLGRLSDRYGRRPILMISILGTAISFLLLGLAKPVGAWFAGSIVAPLSGQTVEAVTSLCVLGVIFLSRFLGGLSGGNITVAQAYISDVTDAQNRARGLGLIGAAFGLGFIFGPAVGGILSRWGYAVPALAASALALVNLIIVFFTLPESLTQEARALLVRDSRPLISLSAMAAALGQPRVGPLMTIRLFYALAAALFQTMFSLWAIEKLGLDAQATSLLLVYVGVLAVIVQGGLIGRLTRRFSERRLIYAGSIILAVGLAAWAFTPSVPVLVVVMIPLAFSSGVLNTVINSAITRSVLPQEIGGALGTAGALESFSRIVSPIAGGWMLGNMGPWAPGIAGAIIMTGVSVFARQRLFVNPDPPLAPDQLRPSGEAPTSYARE
jgi:DHA1 family tetracycline resistance protein-like MFS transporter